MQFRLLKTKAARQVADAIMANDMFIQVGVARFSASISSRSCSLQFGTQSCISSVTSFPARRVHPPEAPRHEFFELLVTSSSARRVHPTSPQSLRNAELRFLHALQLQNLSSCWLPSWSLARDLRQKNSWPTASRITSNSNGTSPSTSSFTCINPIQAPCMGGRRPARHRLRAFFSSIR